MILDNLLKDLQEADNDDDRSWILLSLYLDTLSDDLRKLVWSAAIPHWFNEDCLKVLRPELAEKSPQLFVELRTLPFVEPFLQRGSNAFNIHETTRILLLKEYHLNKKEELVLISRKAKNYFQTLKNDALGNFGTLAERLNRLRVAKKDSIFSILNWVDENLFHIIGLDPRIELEIIYHQFSINYDKAVDSLISLGTIWYAQDRYDQLNSLRDFVADQNSLEFLGGRAVGWGLYYGALADGVLVSSQKAIETYQTIIHNNYEDANLIAKAKSFLAQVLAIEEDDLERAELYAKEALATFRDLREKGSEMEALMILAKIERRLWRIESAKSNLDEALLMARNVKNKHDEGVIYSEFGSIALKAFDLKTAKQYLERALLLVEPLGLLKINQIAILEELGIVLMKLGEFEKSSILLQRAHDLAKVIGYRASELYSTIYLGDLANLEGNYELAFDLWSQAVNKFEEFRIPKDQAAALIRSANLHCRLKSYDIATEIVTKAYELNPRNTDSLLLLSYIHLNLREYEKATHYIQRAKEIDPLDPRNSLHLGRLMIFQGSYEESFTELQTFLKFANHHALAYMYLGLVFIGLEQKEEALQEFQKGLTEVYLARDIEQILDEIEQLDNERKEFKNIKDVVELIKSWRPKNTGQNN